MKDFINFIFKGKTFAIISVIFLIIVLLFFITEPDVGPNTLTYEFIKAISFMIGGLYYILMFVVDVISKKKMQKRVSAEEVADEQKNIREDSLERNIPKVSFKMIFVVLFGIILIGLGLVKLKDCIADYQNGTEEIVLVSTSAEYEKSHSTGTYRTKSHYDIKGKELSTGADYSFRFKHLSDSVQTAINSDSDKIIMDIYPNTKTIANMEIHYAGNVIILPGEKVIQEQTSSETALTGGEQEQQSSVNQDGSQAEMSLIDQYGLPEYEIGGDIQEFRINMGDPTFSNGFRHKTQMIPSNIEEIELRNAQDQELRDTYNMPDNCKYEIYYKGNIEMLVFYDKESYAIIGVFVREKQ